MDFGTAIKTCFKKFGTFEGRAGKAEFWYFYLLAMGLNVVSYFVDLNYFGIREGFGPASTIVGLVFAIPGMAVAARRLHDVGKSGWWQLIALTGIGLIPLLFWWTSDPVRGSGKTKRRAPVEDYDDTPRSTSALKSRSTSALKSRSTSGKIDVIDELEELKELYEDGTLSEAQFKKAKKKLLK